MCTACSELRFNYRIAVEAYSRASRNLRGALGDDFKTLMLEITALHAARVQAQSTFRRALAKAPSPTRQGRMKVAGIGSSTY